MKLLGNFKNELPCPDSLTMRGCIGKVRFTVSSYCLDRDRGRHVIKIREAQVFCSRCGKIFKIYKDIFPESDSLAIFEPTGKKKTKKQLYKAYFKK